MTRSTCFRPCALLLVLALLAPPVFAAPPRPAEERPGVLALLWQALGQLLPPLAKLGPEMDPGGTPSDLGAGMDPAGTPADLGAGMDPGGAPTADLGASMDPAGAPQE